MTNPAVSIIIVTYNSSSYIISCLKSITRQKDVSFEIIVVDNNSSDNTVETIKNSSIKVQLIAQDKNLGFSKANNIGAVASCAEYLVFLNPDTELTNEDSLSELLKAATSHPDYGVIGPQLILTDGSVQKSVRNLPTPLGAIKEYLLGVKRSYEGYIPTCQDLCEVESVVGACMIARKEIFKRAGFFNEKYFMYFEDLEFCKKIRKIDLKVGYLPQVKIKHAEGASGLNQKTYQFLHTSAKQYHGLLIYSLIQFVIRLGNFLHL